MAKLNMNRGNGKLCGLISWSLLLLVCLCAIVTDARTTIFHRSRNRPGRPPRPMPLPVPSTSISVPTNVWKTLDPSYTSENVRHIPTNWGDELTENDDIDLDNDPPSNNPPVNEVHDIRFTDLTKQSTTDLTLNNWPDSNFPTSTSTSMSMSKPEAEFTDWTYTTQTDEPMTIEKPQEIVEWRRRGNNRPRRKRPNSRRRRRPLRKHKRKRPVEDNYDYNYDYDDDDYDYDNLRSSSSSYPTHHQHQNHKNRIKNKKIEYSYMTPPSSRSSQNAIDLWTNSRDNLTKTYNHQHHHHHYHHVMPKSKSKLKSTTLSPLLLEDDTIDLDSDIVEQEGGHFFEIADLFDDPHTLPDTTPEPHYSMQNPNLEVSVPIWSTIQKETVNKNQNLLENILFRDTIEAKLNRIADWQETENMTDIVMSVTTTTTEIPEIIETETEEYVEEYPEIVETTTTKKPDEPFVKINFSKAVDNLNRLCAYYISMDFGQSFCNDKKLKTN